MRRAKAMFEMPADYDVIASYDALHMSYGGDGPSLLAMMGVKRQREAIVEALHLPNDVILQYVTWDRDAWRMICTVAGEGLGEKYEWEPGFEPVMAPVDEEGNVDWS